MTITTWTRGMSVALVLQAALAFPAMSQTTVEGGATIVGPNGLTTEIQRSATGQNGNASGTVSVQRDDGKGWKKSWNKTRDNGVVSRDGTISTNNGRVWSQSGERRCDGGVCSGNSVVTGPKGRTYSRDAEWRRTGRGQWEGSVTRTGPDGRSKTSRRWFQIRRQ
ncbi:MAG: hypothetical protein AAFV19_00715 [Pseudomonadota bacterium]